jgi:hypothetical protein
MGLAALDAVRGARFPKFVMQARDGSVEFLLDRGNGDELRAFFTPHGHLVRGFDHEAPRSPYQVGHVWPGMYAGLPSALRSFVEQAEGEPFDGDLFGEGGGAQGRLLPVTFASWWLPGAVAWESGALAPGAPEGGMSFLLGCLDPAIDFLERGWDEGIVERAMKNEALSDADFGALVKGADVARVRVALEAMRYGAGLPYPG